MTIPNPPPYSNPPAIPRSKSRISLRSTKSRSVSASSNELPPPPMPPKPSFFSLGSSKKPNPNSGELAKPMHKLIKSMKKLVSNREVVCKDENSVAAQLSEWGHGTNDDSLQTLSTHLSTILAAIANQENFYASRLEAARGSLKSIRSTEQSVGKSRLAVLKLRDDLNRAKLKGENSRIESITQELERAEAQSLVAESQLSNVSRQKLKASYTAQLYAAIERAEKQAMLAKQGIRLLNLLDDTPLIPPAERTPFEHDREARAILTEAEEGLRDWTPEELEIGIGSSFEAPYPDHLRFPQCASPVAQFAAGGGMRRVNPNIDVHPTQRGGNMSESDSTPNSLVSPIPQPWGAGMTSSPLCSSPGTPSSSEKFGMHPPPERVMSPSMSSEYSSYSNGSARSYSSAGGSSVRPRMGPGSGMGAGKRSVTMPIRYPNAMNSGTGTGFTREVTTGGPEGYAY